MPLLEESYARLGELGYKRFGSECLLALGQVAQAQGDHPLAERLLTESLRLYEERGDTLEIVEPLCALGVLAAEQGDGARATALLRQGLIRMREAGGTRTLAACLEGLAQVASTEGKFERTTMLCATAAGARCAMGTPLPPIDRERYERALADARRALGEERFAALWAEGEAMTLDQAVALAFE
jgi:hypothetical protein